jgi:hypothetical protein
MSRKFGKTERNRMLYDTRKKFLLYVERNGRSTADINTKYRKVPFVDVKKKKWKHVLCSCATLLRTIVDKTKKWLLFNEQLTTTNKHTKSITAQEQDNKLK